MNSPIPADPASAMVRPEASAVVPASPMASPVQLRAAAHLYGIDSVPLAGARVLELGGGSAEASIAFALAYPSAQMVRVDESAERIGEMRAWAERAGAGNLSFHAMDWARITPEFGQFDYILADGIYGRGGEGAGEALLQVCRHTLSPLGLACVDYRTQPGWKAAEIVRDLLAMQSHSATSDADLIGGARSALSVLAEGISPGHPYAGMLAEIVRQARNATDEELLRDYLIGNGGACYFAEFVDRAAQAGLAYLGDAQPQLELPATFGTQVALTHSLFCLGKPGMLRQQYLDFSVGRKLRRSMLMHADRQESPLAAPSSALLQGMHLAASALRIQEGDGAFCTYRFYSGSRRVVATRGPEVANVVEILSHAWPASMTFGELVEQTHCRNPAATGPSEHEKAVAKALEVLFMQGVLRYSVDPGPYDEASDGLGLVPHIERVLREAPAEQRDFTVYNLWQEPVALALTPQERELALAAGEHEFDALVTRLVPPAQAGGEDLDAATAVRHEQARDTVAVQFDLLKRAGLLHGSHEAWQAYFAAAMVTTRLACGYRYGYPDALLLHARLAKAGPNRNGKRRFRGTQAAEAPESHTDYVELLSLFKAGRWRDAQAVGERCIRQFPEHGQSWCIHSNVLRHLGKLAQARDAALRSVTLLPLEPATHSALGLAYKDMQMLAEVESAFRRALLLDPDSYSVCSNMAGNLRWQARYPEAEAYCRRAIEIEPEAVGAYGSLAMVQTAIGRLHEAVETYRKAIALRPDPLSYSNMLFTMCHIDDLDPDFVLREHLAFGAAMKMSAGETAGNHANSREPERPLRVGFVSGDLCRHAVASFVEPIWATCDRQAWQIHVYSNTVKDDDVTERLRGYAHVWRTVLGLTDAELADQIRQDRVDVLFDLSGHTGLNRLPAFARKPAPVQVSWIGYPGTTGLSTMDYYLIDRHVAPPGYLDAQFTEKLVYLPSCATFQPTVGGPPVNELPALGRGHITFGSFNRLPKITDLTLDLWARVLRAIPDSIMLIGGIESPLVEEPLARRFSERGIGRERLNFRNRGSISEYMLQHHEVDIALDTFPYAGGTTTYYSLRMGVPVLTLRGRTRVSCQTAGILGSVGLPEWIADDNEDFVRSATAWAADLPGLARLRLGMRDKVRESSSSAETVTRSLERAVRHMWRRWCQGLPPESFTAP